MTTPAAAFVIIGNEILSGRTQDANLKFLGERLSKLGIALKEVRVVADEYDAIIEAVNALRPRHDYVFTSGGIGPTHDDITTEAIARAFGVPVVQHPEAVRMLRDYYGAELTDARLRMACVPEGAGLIVNPVSTAPGFRMENVFVFAGVPKILQAMFDALAPTLTGGPPIESRAVSIRMPESKIAADLAAVQARFPQVALGSYPFARPDGYGTTLVARSNDAQALEAAFADLNAMLVRLGAQIVE
jgi:molybdenum cofactor synthesis domain-containing protein